jgi:hypothetical protein
MTFEMVGDVVVAELFSGIHQTPLLKMNLMK